MTLLTLGYDVNTTDPAQLEEAKTKLAQLVPGVTIFDSDSPKTALIAGDADLGITWTGEAQLAQNEVPAIQFVYPTEGAIKWQDTWAIPAGAPNPDAAYAFLNYINQPELFWTTLRDFPALIPTRRQSPGRRRTSRNSTRPIWHPTSRMCPRVCLRRRTRLRMWARRRRCMIGFGPR